MRKVHSARASSGCLQTRNRSAEGQKQAGNGVGKVLSEWALPCACKHTLSRKQEQGVGYSV